MTTALLLIGIPVALISVSILIVVGSIMFRDHTRGKFGYKFFRFWHLLSVIFGVASLAFGNSLRNGFDRADFPYHGLVFTAVGIALLSWLLIRNCHKTNLFYGVTGTLFEVVVSFFVFSVGMAFFPFLIWGAVGAAPEAVIVVN